MTLRVPPPAPSPADTHNLLHPPPPQTHTHTSTGITAFMLGCGFVVAMFFAPIFSSIPGYATGPALVVVSVG